MVTAKRLKCAASGCQKLAVPNGRYCCVRHRDRTRAQRYQAKKRSNAVTTPLRGALSELAGADPAAVSSFLVAHANLDALNVTGGPAYDAIVGNPIVRDGILSDTMTVTTIAELTGYGQSTVSKVIGELVRRLRVARDAAGWVEASTAGRLVGRNLNLSLDPERYRLGDPVDLEALIEELVGLFVEWRDTFCTDERGVPYVTKDFHRRWIRALIGALLGGKRVMVLSPPRHGKTQLLIDFCTWLIIALPNVRLLWVAANGDLAGDWLAALEDQFDNNDALAAAYLEPGLTWRPKVRTGKAWSRKQFTVATRTVTGIKSPTMQAVGRGGRILSRDVDFMIVDDIEDDESVETPGSRAKTRKWFTVTAGGRKMEHTGVAVLGSRQDPDDLYGYLIDNVEWGAQVEEAHASDCTADPFDEDAHQACMLFPEVRSYRWLQSQRRSMALEGGDEMYEMQYLNRAIPRGLMVFNEAEMRKCLNPVRICGEFAPGSLLVAGVDPSPTSHQAGFLWGYHEETNRLQMVDSVLDTGPGIPGFLELLRSWTSLYPTLRAWVVEDNAFQRGYLMDPEVRAFAMEHNLSIQGHQTQQNKWHRDYGVGALARMFNTEVDVPSVGGLMVKVRLVDLPYGDSPSIEKVERYIRQARTFASSGAEQRASVRAGNRADELMASWFPLKVIRSWRSSWTSAVAYEGYEPSFASFSRTEWERVPWR